MKKIVIIVFIIIVCLVGFFYFKPNAKTKTTTDNGLEKIIVNENEINDKNISVPIKFNETILIGDNKKLILDINQDVNYSEEVNTYTYQIKETDDNFRENLFNSMFGERAKLAQYDEKNQVWELKNSNKAADYWLYIASGGEFFYRDGFVLEYRLVNLNTLDSNQMKNLNDIDIGISKENAVELCDKLIKDIDSENEYKVDWIHAYGRKNGSNPLYWINYKKIINDIPITAYSDLYCWVDKNGIQRVYGALYNANVDSAKKIISPEEAVNIIKDNSILISTSLINASQDTINIKKMSLEYVVIYDYENSCDCITPVWRFQIGANDDERNLYRDRILAVNATNGEIIQERRENEF